MGEEGTKVFGSSEERAKRVESVFHEQVWALANDSTRIEQAVAEARDICYTVLEAADDDESVSCWEARRWVNKYGRDSSKEIRVQRARDERREEREAATDAT